MRWNKFRLKTTSEAEDLVIYALSEAGIEGVEVEDKVPLSQSDLDKMFVDIMPAGGPDDGVAYLSFYLDADEDPGPVLERVRQELDKIASFADLGECSIERSQTEDVDWINNWKQYFKQFYVDDMLIIPSWEEVKPEDEGRLILHIDPGSAFGTGMHETTQLCLKQVKAHIRPGMQVLDIGTGSGILSIAALKMGAAHAQATDLDPGAVGAVADNLEANDLSEDSLTLHIGNLIDDEALQKTIGTGKYDMVLANILAEILIPMAPAAAAAMKEGGILIMSGILEGKETAVAQALEKEGLMVTDIGSQGEWRSVTAVKPVSGAR